MIGGMSREKAGYPLIGYFASNNAFASGLKSPKDLAGKRIELLREEGAISVDGDGRLRVTQQGFPVLEAVVADLAA